MSTAWPSTTACELCKSIPPAWKSKDVLGFACLVMSGCSATLPAGYICSSEENEIGVRTGLILIRDDEIRTFFS